MKPFNGIIVALALVVAEGFAAEMFYAVRSLSRLLTKKHAVEGLYDGDDSIYLFGGYHGGDDYPNSYSKDVSKYSISTDRVFAVGNLMYGTNSGRLTTDFDGNILYVGGYGWINKGFGPTPTQRLNLSDGTISIAGEANMFGFGLVKTEARAGLIFGGVVDGTRSENIYQWSMDTERVQPIGDWPDEAQGSHFITFRHFLDNKIYYIKPSLSSSIKVYVHDLVTNTTETLSNDITNPFYNAGVKGTYDGTYAYLFGRSRLNRNSICLKYNVVEGTSEVIPIVHISGSPINWIYVTEPVFVPKLNRIYLFGGHTGTDFYDGIWYIDLAA